MNELQLQVPTSFPRVDLFLHVRTAVLELRVTTAADAARPVFVLAGATEHTAKELGQLLELLQVPVAVFIDR